MCPGGSMGSLFVKDGFEASEEPKVNGSKNECNTDTKQNNGNGIANSFASRWPDDFKELWFYVFKEL
jgi:hypothetical protein